ncbi:hypothetical protein NVP1101O_139 [Vibrio phage 1.101.O._10N.261.45.C6]|nr:hypothetical protein NVP1101O_139 [Vibrio phage 1.101.O._10N.261.45.C6]
MGDMADYFLSQIIDEEGARDDYVSGFMSQEEAFERGFIDHQGCMDKGLEDAWERSGIPSWNNVQNELKFAISDLDKSTYENFNTEPYMEKYRNGDYVRKCSDEEIISVVEALGCKVLSIDDKKAVILNKEATENLNYEVPTCNFCREFMTPREGRYGKFYFCGNYCEEQKNVSDTYWQSVRNK